ncbi:acyl-CoA dehydrogenase family protein [Ferrimicrobium acidiphilum]|uniref:acyl-CoA dehydrogenase family protein n=1 Tax=Ferrimicrobium acidiphilum TaxID=121039 RepID=UPI0023F0AE5A|nr:acyl-CoA dehydrogenase family protein [Ferrimicrobium acidiphilum]
MDLSLSSEAEDFRRQFRSFLARELPKDFVGVGGLEIEAVPEFIAWWRTRLYENGFLAVSWPKEYGGRGLTVESEIVIAQESAIAGVPTGGPNDHFGIQMLGNTLLVHGSEEQRSHFLPRIVDGSYRFAQGYSEPNAGSDLAALALRGRIDGQELILDGQKIWTSEAHLANWMFVLARTDTDAPKHRGISFVLVPLGSSADDSADASSMPSSTDNGVEIRPIRMISGKSEFNEVFFTGTRSKLSYVVGGLHQGWAVAMTLLGFERGETAATLPIRFQAELDRLGDLLTAKGKFDDPDLLDRFMGCQTRLFALRAMGYSWLSSVLSGAEQGAQSSIFKLFWSEYHQLVTELAVDALGEDALLPVGRPSSSAFRTDDVGAPNSTRSWDEVFLHARAGTIYAGTSEIQRSIIGERLLGLPREPRS